MSLQEFQDQQNSDAINLQIKDNIIKEKGKDVMKVKSEEIKQNQKLEIVNNFFSDQIGFEIQKLEIIINPDEKQEISKLIKSNLEKIKFSNDETILQLIIVVSAIINQQKLVKNYNLVIENKKENQNKVHALTQQIEFTKNQIKSLKTNLIRNNLDLEKLNANDSLDENIKDFLSEKLSMQFPQDLTNPKDLIKLTINLEFINEQEINNRQQS